jgi:nucleotide-binding universal stress UspA family protein
MRLLVAVDITEAGNTVANAAAEWAQRLGATLDLVFVQEYGSTAALVHDARIRALIEREWDQVREHQAKQLHEMLEKLPAEVRGKAFTQDGPPAQLLVELGKEYDAIVVGTHGRTGLGHLFLGSVAERIVRTATVSVLVLRITHEG